MKARRLPGVRCSTLNTECRSLLCLMIIPGRSWVAGIDICGNALLLGFATCLSGASQQETTHQCYRPEINILYGICRFGNLPGKGTQTVSTPIQLNCTDANPRLTIFTARCTYA